jgi:GTP-binding protein EngB required for normal cell division
MPPSLFNENQQRAILHGLLDLHHRMAEMEAQIDQALRPSPLSRFINDLSPTEVKVVRDYFDRLRCQILDCLGEAGIPLEIRRGSLRWTVQCSLLFLLNTVADLGPRALRGSGPLSDAAAASAVKIQQDMTRVIDRVSTYLRQGLGRDLAERLARLGASPVGAATLASLDRIVTRRGLLEFRPLLDQIVRRLEAPQFEIAVFGRVSSGKSTLLNHVAGMDVLPVGVTPVTAVPTRLVRGDRPTALVSFAEVPARTVGVEHLREYAAEEGNPDNHKHVTGILVQVPSPRLRESVVLVDTPGIGALARSGSAETFAYLSQCDLGVVLLDAASTLTPDDQELLRLLYEAAVPAQVVLSKADLLSPADRQKAADYVREHLRRELAFDVAVHPVSTVGADQALLTRWFEEEIEPLLARHRSQAEESLRRKIAHLRESVVASLETLRERSQSGAWDGRARMDARGIRTTLEEADEAIRGAELRARDWTDDEAAVLEIVINDAAREVVSPRAGPAAVPGAPVVTAAQHDLAERGQRAFGLLGGLKDTLVRALQSLQELAPLLEADAPALREFTFRGLPAPNLAPLKEQLHVSRPWWGPRFPRLSIRAVRRRPADRLAGVLGEQVKLYDRQVQAWLKNSLAELVELYEAQADVFRALAEAPAVAGGAAHMGTGADDLEADIQELRRADLAGDSERRDDPAPLPSSPRLLQ